MTMVAEGQTTLQPTGDVIDKWHGHPGLCSACDNTGASYG